MPLKPRRSLIAVACVVVGTAAVSAAWLNDDDEHERKVTEKEVPKPALDALKKQAAGAPLTKTEEEKEHGTTFYEGQWKGEHGRVEALVTADGNLVEIEEEIATDRLPAAALAAAQKQAGAGANMRWEKKTQILYEVKFKKGNSYHELLLTPDGRVVEHEDKSKDED